MALFDSITTFLDATLAEVQNSSDSLTTHFSAEVKEARLTIMQLLKSSVRSAVGNGLVDKVGGAVEILSAKHWMPSPAAEFLQLPDKLNTLCNVLFKSDKDLQVTRCKTEEKSMLEAKIREDLQRG